MVEAARAATRTPAPGPAAGCARLVGEPAVEFVLVRDPKALRDRAAVEVVVYDDIQSKQFLH
ncbi:MAG: hypothetical protein OXH15_09965 [Gammaproteobacteria bacterium]|nr:hypothetical protein [Gammaproteobacteria bacterium]